MDGQDEILTNNNNIGAQYIVKGKRTKRQRPQSPIPFRMITGSPTTTINSYKSDQGSDICSSNNNNIVEDTTTAATTTNMVSDDDDIYFLDGAATIDTTTTEEEEDMAKCLILLAQGHSRELPLQQPPPPLLSLGQTGVNHNYNNIPTSGNNNITKFVSRKFMESGKSGYYVYECKTCSKTFSSFQALGGHRASHKKPKNKDEDYNNAIKNRSNHNFNTYLNTNTNTKNYINNNSNNYTSNIMISSDDEDPPFKVARHNNNNFASSTSLSLQLTNRALYSGISNHHNKGRVHECSICGAEFSSGQALGGHMRRHRGLVNPAGGPSAPPAIPAIPISMEQPSGPTEMCDEFMLTTMKMAPPINNNSSSALSLDLDLNLPAPPEETNVGDHQKEGNKLVFETKQQQPELTNEKEQQPPSPPPLPPSPPPPPPPPQQQPPQQQIVLSSPALVDCHY